MKKALQTTMRILLFLLVLGLTLNVQIVQSAGDSWPMFHRDLAHTGYSPSTAPTTNQTLWSYATGASVGSSPAVVDVVIYVGSADHKVYALNAADGSFKWSYTTGEAVESSPAVVDGIVYVGSNDNKTYALNAATGALIWSYPTGGYVASSPAVVGAVVIVGSYDHKVYALNAANGASIWNYTTGAEVASSPAVADGKVYVGSNDKKLYALDASTGTLVWSYETGNWVRSSPAIVEGKLYVGSYDNKIYAFSSLPTPTFTLAANTTAVASGVFFKLNGTLSIPRTSPPNITLQWAKDSSGFIYQQTFDTITNGIYIRDIAFSAAGTYQFRVTWSGDATSNAATSNVVTVAVQEVIPEFPSTLLMFLIVMSLSAGALVVKKKFLKRS